MPSLTRLQKVLLKFMVGMAGAAMLCGAAPIFQPIDFSSSEKAGVDEIKAQFFVQADPKTAWDVLSNYEQIPQFVNSMKISHVEKIEDGDVYLTQEAEQGFLFITKRVHVLLKVHEVPGQSISFQDISHKDFYFYQGSWDLDPSSQGGVTVSYHLVAQKNFDVPFAGDYLHGGVKDLLKAVQKEIYLRQIKINKEIVHFNPVT